MKMNTPPHHPKVVSSPIFIIAVYYSLYYNIWKSSVFVYLKNNINFTLKSLC